MEFKILIVLHMIGACIWFGGHAVLLFTFVPAAWKERSVEGIREFERHYEKIGLPALALQIITGLRLAMIYLPEWSMWFDWSDRTSTHVSLKVIFLIGTAILGAHARLILIPKLTPERLPAMIAHIIGIMILAFGFLLTGISIRYGLF